MVQSPHLPAAAQRRQQPAGLLLLLLLVVAAAWLPEMTTAHGHQHLQHHQHHQSHRHMLQGDSKRTGPIMRCGTPTPSAEQVASFERDLAIFAAANANAQTATEINITVIFHVITDGAEGNLTDETIWQQMAVLNQGYKETPFKFVLGGVTRTSNRNWMYVSPGKQSEQELKQAMRQGGADVLNVYSALPTLGWYGTLLGYATFPFGRMSAPSADKNQLAMDGVVINYGSVPGGESWSFNLGATLVHEVGHWLGLYHTFEGGCVTSHRGDYVDDTPAEGYPSSSCDARDSCEGPRFPGEDPVTNFMDYSPDACLNHFTQGQIERMINVWQSTRAPGW